MRKALWIGCLLLVGSGCIRGPAVQTHSPLSLRRVVIYRNGVGYFERQGTIEQDSVEFRVRQSEVGDFLATLAVMERGGSSVQSAAFPLPGGDPRQGTTTSPDDRRAVRLRLDGRRHDLRVGYMVETPVWRPSYRLVFQRDGVQVQAWGIVQNLSGEDWRDVRLSLVSGSPVTFRSDLAEPILTQRPIMTDRGEVLEVVPRGDTTLAQGGENEQRSQAALADARPTSAAAPVGGTATVTRGAYRIDRAGGGRSSGGGLLRAEAQQRPGRRSANRERSRANAGAAGDYYDDLDEQTSADGSAPQAPMLRPRSIASLAAVAVQGGTTRYDLPAAVTVPDRSATMVLLAARDVPGERVYLFAPDGGVPESSSHPFQVARFTNRTGALLERGPVAIFEQGAFLGQGLLEPLPDGAQTTVPFALERAVAVESSSTNAIDGARLMRILRGEITLERYRSQRVTYRVRNGLDRDTRVLIRHGLDSQMRLHEPPPGTEQANGAALVPVRATAHGQGEVQVQTRVAFALTTDWTDENSAIAIEEYIRTGNPAAPVAEALRQALDHRRVIVTLSLERSQLVERRDDLQHNAEETRENLEAIRRNPGAADLRTRLTTRLGQVANQIDQATRRIVELDTQIGERRVRLLETVRTLDVNTATPRPTT